MKNLAIAIALVALTACAQPQEQATPSADTAAQVRTERSYGFRDATRDYPYNPPGGG